MRRKALISGLVFLSLAASAAAQQPPAAATAKPDERPEVQKVLDRQLATVERLFVGAAEAMPAEKFEFVPTGGEFEEVRSFAQQVKHVAAANMAIAAALKGEQSPYGIPEIISGPPDVKTRADALKLVKDSYAAAHQAIATIDAGNVTESIPDPFGGKMSRLALANLLATHGMDHYGQMVVYLRMNGVVPPASRRN
jgi:uncharacterized damage-inducible protein DinB